MLLDESTPKLIYRFDAVPIKIWAIIFVEIAKLIIKFTQKTKGPPQIAIIILGEKDDVGGLTFPYFNIFCKASLIHIVWY